ncbi:DCN1-like protein 5 [Trametes pubescens]|uniref:Defective in cullin neddylation protein n=1 Tax=Trametes pubescens TaxID=154538 RepID=A0A1M2VXI4_TRAPU|nr:DCN1-like protein 5 [Trametes pubescens]
MAPKRKRSAEDATSGVAAKATRASSRLKTTANDAEAASSGLSVSSVDGVEVELAPTVKKVKRTTSKSTSTKTSKAKHTNEPPASNNGAAGGSAKSGAARASAPEPYSDAHAKQLFATYQDPDTPGEIGPEGFEKLCTDLDISLEGALPLVLAWQLNGSEMAKFTEEEWVKGTSELRASNPLTLSLAIRDLEDLLLLDKPPIQPPPSASMSAKKKGTAASVPGPTEPYNRQRYYQYAASKDKAFSELYTFCFNLAKPS